MSLHIPVFTNNGNINNRRSDWACRVAAFFLACVFTIIVNMNNACASENHVTTQAWKVKTLVSEPGEDKTAFLRRAGAWAMAWTDENHAETCAFVATDGQRWGLELLTIRSQADCVTADGLAPEGMHVTEESFHTHPRQDRGGFLYLNDDTLAAMKRFGEDVKRKPRWFRVENNNSFSERDIADGPGYLATEGRLLFQNGKGKKNQKDLGELPSTETR